MQAWPLMLRRRTCYSLHTAKAAKQYAQHQRINIPIPSPLFIGDENKPGERDLQLQCDAMQAHLMIGWLARQCIGTYVRSAPYWQVTKFGSPSHAKTGKWEPLAM